MSRYQIDTQVKQTAPPASLERGVLGRFSEYFWEDFPLCLGDNSP